MVLGTNYSETKTFLVLKDSLLKSTCTCEDNFSVSVSMLVKYECVHVCDNVIELYIFYYFIEELFYNNFNSHRSCRFS